VRKAGDMTIIPDTKNWTWVIERPCPECGFDATDFTDAGIAAAIRENADSWPEALGRPNVRQRPRESTWSTLEYAAHVRDVLRLYRERLAMMVEQEDPLYPNWDQDATAVAERYDRQDPAVVSTELTDAAAGLASAFEALDAAQWHRQGRRGDGASFTVTTFARYLLHDLVHHRWDVSN
jgi:hypothetical protein